MSQLIVCGKDEKPAYMLKKHGSGITLCYEMHRWKDAWINKDGEERPAGWVASGKFPVTIADGLRTIAQDIELNNDWSVFCKANTKSLTEAANYFKSILDGFSLKMEDSNGEEAEVPTE